MEAGILVRPIWSIPKRPLPFRFYRHSIPTFPRFIKASAKTEEYRGPKPRKNWIADWVSKNDDVARSLPIYTGGFSLLAVLFNRAIFGIAPVTDASSSQSRADLLALGLAVTNVLTGLVWLSIRPKSISKVEPEGMECHWISPYLPDTVVSELEWFWQSLSDVTCCRSLVIVYDGICILQVGVAAESSSGDGAETVDAAKLIHGALCEGIMKSGAQNYLANLSLYPSKSELPFLPPNTQVFMCSLPNDCCLNSEHQNSKFLLTASIEQAVVLQPLGDKGIAVIGGDTIRGFTNADQAWISLIGDKLDATLMKSLTRTESLAQNTG